jgi:hypothetical protein
MAIIFTYPVIKAADLASTDRLIISKMNSVGNNPTKSLTLADLSTYISAALTALPTVADDYSDDTAAAAAGIPQGGFYHTSGVVKINITP